MSVAPTEAAPTTDMVYVAFYVGENWTDPSPFFEGSNAGEEEVRELLNKLRNAGHSRRLVSCIVWAKCIPAIRL